MLALIVSDFQREIVAVAKAESRGLGGFPQVSQLLVVAGFFAGIVYMISNPEWIGNPLYHGLGLAIALASVLVVRYVIDPRIVVCSMDERFSEYGLLSSFRYESVFLRRSVGRFKCLSDWSLSPHLGQTILVPLVSLFESRITGNPTHLDLYSNCR